MPAYYGDDQDARPRATAADYYYSDGAPGPFASGAIPVPSNPRLPYPQPQSPLYPYTTPNTSVPTLHPDARHLSPHRRRPRSLPPPARRKSKSRRSAHDHSPVRHDDGPRSPIQDARHLIHNTFSNSNSGLGIGVLGALAGGLIAHEATNGTAAKSRPRTHGRRVADDHKSPLIPTIVGAAVAGLAANAFEKRIEVAKVRNAEKQEAWERKWGPDLRPDMRDGPEEDRGRRSGRRSSGIYYHGHGADSGDFYGRSAR